MKDKEKLNYVGVCDEIECCGALWIPKDSKDGMGALFIPEFGTKIDTTRVIRAMKGIIETYERGQS